MSQSDIELKVPNFDTAFQRGMLRIALLEDHFATQMVRYIANTKEVKAIKVFNTTPLQIIFECICKSIQKYNTRPSDAQIRQYIAEFAPEEQDGLANTYQEITQETAHDAQYFKDHLTSFVQQVLIAKGIHSIKESWKRNKLLDPELMQKTLDEVYKVRFEADDVLTLDDIQEVVDSAQDILKDLIPTGLVPLDKDLLGGLPRETLVTVLGGTNVGKSLFCISMAANALSLGHKVLHIQLEGMRNEALLRYTANLADVPLRAIFQKQMNPQQKTQVEKVKDYAKNLKIINMLDFGVTVEELNAKCGEVYKDFRFDFLLVDYSQLLETKADTEGARHVQAKVHRTLAAMARKYYCTVVTPIQATRGAQKEQTEFKNKKKEGVGPPVLRSDDISEAFEIARVAGVILTLNRTDDEKGLRVFLEKQRLDEKNKLYGVYPNYANCRLITKDLYDPKAVAESESIFNSEDDNDERYTSLASGPSFNDKQNEERTRKRINTLIGRRMSINGEMKAKLEGIKTTETGMANEERATFEQWMQEKEEERKKVTAEIKALCSVLHPKASKEEYQLMKESLKDLEKTSDAPKHLVLEQKEKVKHYEFLFEK